MLRPVKPSLSNLKIKIDQLIDAIDKKLIKRQFKKDYEEKLALFKETSNILKFEDIPWPCDGSPKDMIDILLFDYASTLNVCFYFLNLQLQKYIFRSIKNS